MSFSSQGIGMQNKKSSITWSNRQIWHWSTKWSRSKAIRVFPRECTGHNTHPLLTTHEKTLHMDINQMVNTEIRLIIFFAAKDGEALYSQQKEDQQLSLAQVINSLLSNSNLNWIKCRKPLDPCSPRGSPRVFFNTTVQKHQFFST